MKIILYIILLFLVLNSIAQDTIIMKNGTIIQAELVNLYGNKVNYKPFLGSDVKSHSIRKSEIEKIIYKNGKVEVFAKLNPRKDHPIGVNIVVGGPTVYLSSSIDYFLTPCINIEAGLGLFGYYGGIKYHFWGNNEEKNWTPYIGISRTTISIFGLFGLSDVGGYAPIGLQFIGENGISLAIEGAGLFFVGDRTNTLPPVWSALRFGYHF